MASDFETVIAKCDGCKHEEECREMPPCIMDAYNKGRTDAIDECINEIYRECDEQDLYLPIHIRYILEQLKEQNNDT